MVQVSEIIKLTTHHAIGDELFQSIKQYFNQHNSTDHLYFCLTHHGLAPHFYFLLTKNPEKVVVPEIFYQKIKGNYLKTLTRNMILYEHFKKIQGCFFENNIEVIPLKGIFLAENFYDNIGLRQMSDIDLFVREHQAKKCITLLEAMGYQKAERVKTKFISEKIGGKHLPTMALGDVFVEIHFRVQVDNSARFIDTKKYWLNSNITSINGISTLALANEQMLQYLCIHLERHFNEGNLRMYQFKDILTLLNLKNSVINWTAFENNCIEDECEKNVYRILSLAEKYFQCSFPPEITAKNNRFYDTAIAFAFELYLKCDLDQINKSFGNQSLKNLKNINGFSNKLKYAWGNLFPDKSFMLKRYNIKKPGLVYIYYIKRIAAGLKAIFRHLTKSGN